MSLQLLSQYAKLQSCKHVIDKYLEGNILIHREIATERQREESDEDGQIGRQKKQLWGEGGAERENEKDKDRDRDKEEEGADLTFRNC